MRGEQEDIRITVKTNLGSPPHARGAECVDDCGDIRKGITPACAGSSRRSLSNLSHVWDHPRMRGEQLYSGNHHAAVEGSPPHARGAAFAYV